MTMITRVSLFFYTLLLLSTRVDAFLSQSLGKSQHLSGRRYLSSLFASKDALDGLDVAICGGGPSGLLLAHKLLASGAKVSLFESRPRPREVAKETRAYALGVGMRGRTAIQSVDSDLWKSVKSAGFASERFHLHIGPLRLRLRDGDSKNKSESQEPSVLFYQTDLCKILAEELENRWSGPNLRFEFDTKVDDINLSETYLKTSSGEKHNFDLVVGCDGVNSAVRPAIEKDWPAFESSKEILPGELKVVRLPTMPPKLDPTAVALLLPKAGTCTAFVEPTVGNGCCVLFAGNNASDPLLVSTNEEELKETLLERFPLLEGAPLDIAAEQLMSIKTSKAASVVCNTYHYSNVAALIGDSAHATGGVSGQGVNSALMDSKVLAECLVDNFTPTRKTESLRTALLKYSQAQVPEGKALFELSFGPKPKSVWQKVGFQLSTLRDSIFRGRLGVGKLPLQTLLTTSLVPFADIRQERNRFYDEPFPSKTEWAAQLAALDGTAKEVAATK